jgi:ribosomal RNA assembly protein
MEGTMAVRTTSKTVDPYAIIKARDIIKCLARSVPYQIALTLLEDEVYCNIIKIKSFVRDKQVFVKRRQRLVGPEGATLKALEILTECYMLVQGNTVTLIGHYTKLKVARRVVEEVMKNVHPVYHIKELMIKKELSKDEKLKNENWARFLPEFKKIKDNRKKKKKVIYKKKKEGHAPRIQPRKEDLAMESGEYFMKNKGGFASQKAQAMLKRKNKREEKIKQRVAKYQEPDKEIQSKKKEFGLSGKNFSL